MGLKSFFYGQKSQVDKFLAKLDHVNVISSKLSLKSQYLLS